MGNYNVYELLYMYHAGCTYAGNLMEETVQKVLYSMVHEKIKTYCKGSMLYFDDLYQEAVIAMYEAMNAYRDDRQASFMTYLKIVVDRRLKNTCRDLFLRKNNRYFQCISLDELFEEVEIDSLLVMESHDFLSSPEYKLHFNECRENLDKAISGLTASEKEVMYSWVNGDTYAVGAEKLKMPKKAYDGKLQKVRKKIREYCDIHK